MAQEYLEEKWMMRLSDYVNLTGLSRTFASIELREFRNDSSTGITFKGRGPHKVYILNEKA